MISPHSPAFPDEQNEGLTIREYASIHLLAAFIASWPYKKGETEQKAINAADELLKRLNEK